MNTTPHTPPALARAKTILAVLPHIDAYCDAIAKANHTRALESYNPSDTYQIMETIIDKTYKAQVLHNLRVKVLRQLEAAPKKIRQFIDLFYLRQIKLPQVREQLGLSERTSFRLVNNAEQWFADNLEACGITPLWFRQLVANYNWIAQIFAEFSLL